MVEYILDDTPKTPFLIKHYVVIYYLLVILVGLVTTTCFWNHVEDDKKVPLILGILCGTPIFVDGLLTISIRILTHRKK
jgi:hypothetical protein